MLHEDLGSILITIKEKRKGREREERGEKRERQREIAIGKAEHIVVPPKSVLLSVVSVTHS
jgi:hypothetical protein